VEDHKSRQERPCVCHQIGTPDESKPWDWAKAEREREVVRQACRRRKDQDGTRSDEPERKRLLKQMRPASAFPSPAAEDVTRGRTGEPGDDGRYRRPQMRHAKAGEEGELARGKRHRRAEGKPGEPSTDCADAVPVHCPDYAQSAYCLGYSAQRKCHGYLSLRVVMTDDSGSTWTRGLN